MVTSKWNILDFRVSCFLKCCQSLDNLLSTDAADAILKLKSNDHKRYLVLIHRSKILLGGSSLSRLDPWSRISGFALEDGMQYGVNL